MYDRTRGRISRGRIFFFFFGVVVWCINSFMLGIFVYYGYELQYLEGRWNTKLKHALGTSIEGYSKLGLR